jgi:hypothetical protein
MANPNTVVTTLVNTVQTFITTLWQLEQLNAQIATDPNLLHDYFIQQPGQPPPRTDIVEADLDGAYSASQNMVTAYRTVAGGGLPGTNEAYLVKITKP